MPRRIPKLPSEIISDILSRLSVKCLVRFKCVSKAWRSLISHPEFAKMHLKRTKQDINGNHYKIFLSTDPHLSVDPEAYCEPDGNILTTTLNFSVSYPEYSWIEILGSCNGLVCGLLHDNPLIYLWNPSTRESRELAILDYSEDGFYGFGYDFKLEDYKIIRGSISASTNGTDGSKIETQVEVFTLKSNLWRIVEDLCCGVVLGGPGRLANGVLHWLVSQENGGSKKYKMVSFDLIEEKFLEMVPLRGLTDDENNGYLELEVLGDWLCLYSHYGRPSCEAWIMKEYSSEASWTRFLSFKGEPIPGGLYGFQLLWVKKNGNIVFCLDGRELVFYNSNEDTARPFIIYHDGDWFESIVYIEGLVSPNNLNDHGLLHNI
ncbi:unnamed protein product [Dovyalis caffra]|uniref:F-box domain-containing protein n=1 Tax=Dovyalis caffra TaxID=77055 RepID=A0AAV1RF72_9ROSI|nr:unnamed protein product [Dovyalis caffra]